MPRELRSENANLRPEREPASGMVWLDDRAEGLHSWATRFGERGVFRGARAFHAGAVLLLAAAGLGLGVGPLYWAGVVAVALLLAYEHSLVAPGRLDRLDAAFFTVNGVISVVFFLFVALDTVV